jgi:hypothetical protein
MAAPKKATHVMVHPKQYMAVGGVLQRVKKGTEVAMSVEQGKRMVKRGRALVIGEQKAVDLTDPTDNKDA